MKKVCLDAHTKVGPRQRGAAVFLRVQFVGQTFFLNLKDLSNFMVVMKGPVQARKYAHNLRRHIDGFKYCTEASEKDFLKDRGLTKRVHLNLVRPFNSQE